MKRLMNLLAYLKTKITVTESELEIHRRLMSDVIYSAVMPELLDIKGSDPEKALELFRENQHFLLKKYGVSNGHIDFEGDIYVITH